MTQKPPNNEILPPDPNILNDTQNTAEAIAVVNPIVVEGKLLDSEAIILASAAKTILEDIAKAFEIITKNDIAPILEKYGELYSNFIDLIYGFYIRINNVIENHELNKTTKEQLIKKIKTYIEKNNNTDNEEIKRLADKIIGTAINKINTDTTTPKVTQTGGQKMMKIIQSGGKKSLKRTHKSINEFLNSPINASKILSMVEKKGYNNVKKTKTRRRRYKVKS